MVNFILKLKPYPFLLPHFIFYFITKGDNNKSPDSEEVTEGQLIGKVIFKIRYLGYPAIWLHIVQENEQKIEVETGS